jgi:succinate-acetate transporter protein
MQERTVIENDRAIVSDDRITATATVGYACIAITFWMLGMILAGWFPVEGMSFQSGLMYGLGSITLIIIGILTMVYGRGMDTIIFLALAGLFFCLSTALIFFSLHNGQLSFLTGPAQGGISANAGMNPVKEGSISIYYGWFTLCWAVFFCYLWIASFRAGAGRMLFLLLFWLGALAITIDAWTGAHSFAILGGYLLLVAAIIAFVVSASAVLSFEPGKLFRKKTIKQSTVIIEDRSSKPRV